MKHAPYPKVVRLEAYRRIEEIKLLNTELWKLTKQQDSYNLVASDPRVSGSTSRSFARSSAALQPSIDCIRNKILILKFRLYAHMPGLVKRIMSLRDYTVTFDGVMRRLGRFSKKDPVAFMFEVRKIA